MDDPGGRKHQRVLDGDHVGICKFSRHAKADELAFLEVSSGIKFLMTSKKALGELDQRCCVPTHGMLLTC